MALQAALSQVTAFFSPTPTASQRPSRVQPKRKARKQHDQEPVYHDQSSFSSIDYGTTLSESQFEIDGVKHVILDTQPVAFGNDSILLTSMSQNVIPDSQQTITTTPISKHGRSMMSALSQTVSEELPTSSLLPINDFTFRDESDLFSSTPRSTTSVSSRPICVTTQTDPIHVSNKESQTSNCISKEREIAMFRSDGNLSVLSNFHYTRLKFNNMNFNSAEHAYQHKMALFHSRPDVAHKIFTAQTPAQAKRISRAVRKSEQWHESKSSIMSEILLAKSKQCVAFREALLKTRNKRLIHNIDTDSFWGCGPDFMGVNMMGTLLEELRDSLNAKKEPNRELRPESFVPTRKNLRKSNTSPVRSAPQNNAPIITVTKTGRQPTAHSRISSGAQRLSVTESENARVMNIGNSNARQMAAILQHNSLDAYSYFYPGGTLEYIRSRIRHTSNGSDPSHIVIMAGDIEAANGMPSDQINFHYGKLVDEIRKVYPWSRIVLVGLTMAGNPMRQQAIQKLNAFMQHLAATERMYFYIHNNNAKLSDNIHLSKASKVALGRRIAEIITKPHLDYIKRFR